MINDYLNNLAGFQYKHVARKIVSLFYRLNAPFLDQYCIILAT
ncbi:hypothetical protein [Endozoicomonas sp.]